jgi:O-antigen/teichoic acid export membrane protein
LQISTTVIFAQRCWQALSGLVTILLLTHYLSPAEQGWYYSFLSLAAIYTLFDLGLSIVLVQLSAHFFIRIKWVDKGRVSGADSARFLSLVGQSFRVYLLLGITFVFLIIPVGLYFFSHKEAVSGALITQWQWPWILLVTATAMNILALPFLAWVEGSGRVAEAYGVRLLQGVFGSIACWCVLISGWGLWATAMIPALGFVVVLIWLLFCYSNLIKNALRTTDSSIKWSHEIWPLQWRIGLSWLSGYLLTQIYTPILFYYQGAEVAGQMGLSLTIANMLGLLAQSWIARRVPIMAQAAGRKDWKLLDAVFAKDFIVSMLAFIVGALLLCGLHIIFLEKTLYVNRVLSLWPFVGLMGIVFINNITGALAAQLRSFRKEPLVWVSLIGALVSVPTVLWSATYYSVEGLVIAILSIQLLFILPVSIYLWRKCNAQWRLEP